VKRGEEERRKRSIRKANTSRNTAKIGTGIDTTTRSGRNARGQEADLECIYY
jgi:hypothetical protein